MESNLIYEKLFKAMVFGGTQAIIDAAYDIISLPIVVVDTSYKVLALTKDKNLTDDIWNYFLKNESLPDEIVWSFFKDKFIESVCNNPKPVYLNWGNLDIPRISGAIRVNGIIIGYIGVLCPVSEYKEELIDSIDVITNAIAIDMKNYKSANTQNTPLLDIFTRDLLNGDLTQMKQLETWKSNFGHIFKEDYMVAAILPPNNGELGLLQYFSTTLTSKYSNSLSTILSDTLFILFYNVDTEAKRKDILKGVDEKLYSFNTHYSISKRFSNILDAANYRFQVEKSLELGSMIHPDHKGYQYEDYVIPTIFSYSLKKMNSINYVHPIIYQIDNFDKKNDTDYLITLETYILCIGNSRRVAEKLHIHRNTLLYRLNKISELTGCDFEDETLCFKLMLSFQMLKLKNQLYKSER